MDLVLVFKVGSIFSCDFLCPEGEWKRSTDANLKEGISSSKRDRKLKLLLILPHPVHEHG